MFKKLTNYIILLFIFNFTVLHSYTPSSERRIVEDLHSIAFRSSPEEIAETLKKYDSENYYLVKVMEGLISKKISMDLGIRFFKIKQDLYDEDFSLIKNPNKTILVLKHVNDYSLSDFFVREKWNDLIKNIRFTFYQSKLYEKEFLLRLTKVHHALTMISVLEKYYGSPKIADSEIHYQGYNRFVWENRKIKIEFLFQPSKNQFSQKTGYQGTLTMTDKSLSSKASSHLSKVKSKLRRLMNSSNLIF